MSLGCQVSFLDEKEEKDDVDYVVGEVELDATQVRQLGVPEQLRVLRRALEMLGIDTAVVQGRWVVQLTALGREMGLCQP